MRRLSVVLSLCLAVACDRRGYTPLILASVDGDPERVAWLLRAGADPNECGGIPRFTTSPLGAAAPQNFVQVVELLLEAGADPNRGCGLTSPLGFAVHNGSLEVMHALIRGGADVNERTQSGSTLLMTAATAVQPETVPILVAAGAPVDATVPDDGTTALMVAAGRDASMTRALLDAGANVHLCDRDGATPLVRALLGAQHAATTESDTWDPAIVEMLLAAGADPHVRGPAGEPLLSMTTATGRHRNTLRKILIRANQSRAGTSIQP